MCGVHLLSFIHSFNSIRQAPIMCWAPDRHRTCFITPEGLRACEVGLGERAGVQGFPASSQPFCHHLFSCPGPATGRQAWPGRGCGVSEVCDCRGAGRGAEEEKRKTTLGTTEEEKDKSDCSKPPQDLCLVLGQRQAAPVSHPRPICIIS